MSLPDVYQDYVEMAKDDLPTIDESLFQQRILPELLKRNRGQKPNYDYWISLIGVPHREIRVVDSNNQEIFRVPPILSRLPTDIGNTARIGIAGLADLYVKRRSVENPALVDMWFNQQVGNLSPTVHDEDYLRHLRNTMLIYDRYGIPAAEIVGDLSGQIKPKPLSGSTVSEEKPQAVDKSVEASDFDFDGGLSDL